MAKFVKKLTNWEIKIRKEVMRNQKRRREYTCLNCRLGKGITSEMNVFIPEHRERGDEIPLETRAAEKYCKSCIDDLFINVQPAAGEWHGNKLYLYPNAVTLCPYCNTLQPIKSFSKYWNARMCGECNRRYCREKNRKRNPEAKQYYNDTQEQFARILDAIQRAKQLRYRRRKQNTLTKQRKKELEREERKIRKGAKFLENLTMKDVIAAGKASYNRKKYRENRKKRENGVPIE
jgi:hypothetical protein